MNSSFENFIATISAIFFFTFVLFRSINRKLCWSLSINIDIKIKLTRILNSTIVISRCYFRSVVFIFWLRRKNETKTNHSFFLYFFSSSSLTNANVTKENTHDIFVLVILIRYYQVGGYRLLMVLFVFLFYLMNYNQEK